MKRIRLGGEAKERRKHFLTLLYLPKMQRRNKRAYQGHVTRQRSPESCPSTDYPPARRNRNEIRKHRKKMAAILRFFFCSRAGVV